MPLTKQKNHAGKSSTAEDVKKVERRLKSDEKKALKGEKKSKDDDAI